MVRVVGDCIRRAFHRDVRTLVALGSDCLRLEPIQHLAFRRANQNIRQQVPEARFPVFLAFEET
jgi:hypothetical protein